MSPDTLVVDSDGERVVDGAIAAAIRRVRLLGLAEALTWGVAVAAISPAAGALIAAAVAAWRWRTASRPSIVRSLERANPDARNLFVTADELARGTLKANAAVRARVFADAAVFAQRLDLAAAFPLRRLARVALTAALIWTAVETILLWRHRVAPAGAGLLSRATVPDAATVRGRLQVNVAIQPPAYTGLTATTAVDPEQLHTIEGSSVALSIDASGERITVEHEGRVRVLTRGADRRFADRLQVTRTGFIAVTADAGARRTIPIVVSPDALPAVRLTTPGRDLVYAGGNPRITFDARATDDFGLRTLALRYTKVTGSGENYEFQEGEIPLSLRRSSARDWTGSASRSLAELGLKDGDMLVYRAVASDARPGDGSAASDAFIVEISKLGVAAGDAFTLPQEESKYALSQQMLIVKTQKLHQRRASLAPDDLTEQSLNLAVEQRMIRAEFVFMLGGEINDEEVEAEQSVELQAGRLQNRGQRDLRAATIAMSQAEKLLTGTNTSDALVAERAAVTALQRAFSRDRYILRALAARSQLDPARRLTGSLGDATGWRRVPPDPLANRRTALLQDLLRGIAELGAARPEGRALQPEGSGSGDVRRPEGSGSGDVRRPEGSGSGDVRRPEGSGSGDVRRPEGSGPSDVRRARPSGRAEPDGFRQRALVIADEAIRIDPASAPLRQAATELQRAAGAADPAARSKALTGASAAVASEARRAHADAPLASPNLAPALSGAFADAMHARLPAPRTVERTGPPSVERAPR